MNNNDLTSGTPLKQILNFMVPILIGNIFQQFYNMADMIIVGHILGVKALAAVGATGGIYFVIFGFASGIAGGVTVVTAHLVGARETDQVSRSIAASFIICGAVAVVFTALGFGMTEWILKVLNTPGDILQQAIAYQRIIFAGIGATIFYNLIASIVRALGDSRTPLIFLIFASLLNIVLNYFLISFLHMGVQGSSLATVISQLFSGLGCLFYAYRKYPALHIKKCHWKMDREWLVKHIGVGLPMAFQTSVTGIGVMIFQSALNGFGSTTVAAFTACSKVESLAVMPMFSIGLALTTFVAQNYGAGQMLRIRQSVKTCLIVNLCLSIAGSLVVIFLYKPLIQIFVGRNQPEVIEIAHTYLKIVGSFYFAAAVLFVYRSALQGMGNTFMPMIGGFIELIMRVTAALLLARRFGFVGLSMAYPSAWIGAALPLVVAYVMIIKKRGYDRTKTYDI